MALDWFDSFDQYGEQGGTSGNMPALVTYGYALDNTATIAIGLAYGRFAGSRGLYITTGGYTHTYLPIIYGNNVTEYAAFSMYLGNVGTTCQFAWFSDNTTVQVDFRLDGSGHIVITRNGATLATSTNVFSALQWYRIELKVTVDPSAGFAECLVNGVSWVSFTGNTRASANSYSNKFYFGLYISASGSQSLMYDDFLVYNGAGVAPNGYLGDKRMITNFPKGAGTSTQLTQNASVWAAAAVMAVGQQIVDSNGNIQQITVITSDFKTAGSHPIWPTTVGTTIVDNHVTWKCISVPEANWGLVCEPTPDGDNSYVYSIAAGQIDRYVYSGLPATSAGVVGVGIVMYSRKDDAGSRAVRTQIKSGATIADNGADIVLSSTYTYAKAFFAVDPDTTVAWTPSGVNALEAGPKLTL